MIQDCPRCGADFEHIHAEEIDDVLKQYILECECGTFMIQTLRKQIVDINDDSTIDLDNSFLFPLIDSWNERRGVFDENKEIQDCPFCGAGEAYLTINDSEVICEICGGGVSLDEDDKNKTLEFYNKRVDDE